MHDTHANKSLLGSFNKNDPRHAGLPVLFYWQSWPFANCYPPSLLIERLLAHLQKTLRDLLSMGGLKETNKD